MNAVITSWPKVLLIPISFYTQKKEKRKKENLRLVLRQELPRKDQDLNPRRFKTVLIYDYNSDLEMMDGIIKEKNMSVISR